MRLAHEVMRVGAATLLVVSAQAHNLFEGAVGEPCANDQDCMSGCCGSQVLPSPLCLEALSQGSGEICYTGDGCDCEGGLCDEGVCTEGTPSPATASEVCADDSQCDSGCCASQLEPQVCVLKATLYPGEACGTGDGCDCLYGICDNGICAACENDDHCPDETECCGDGTCVGDISECGLTPAPTKAPTPTPTTPPTKLPTPAPTALPTKSPTQAPTASPTTAPTPGTTIYQTEQFTPAPTSSPIRSPAPSSITSPTATLVQSPPAGPTRKTVVAASVVGVLLLVVLVLTGVGLKTHCTVQTWEGLRSKGSFWVAMVVLAGVFIALSVFQFGSMWGIMSVCACFMIWLIVVALFVVFKARDEGRGSPT